MYRERDIYIYIYIYIYMFLREYGMLSSVKQVFSQEVFRIARAGIFPRSSLLGAGQLGLCEFGKGGTPGEGWGK
jgi:hypothetical protein